MTFLRAKQVSGVVLAVAVILATLGAAGCKASFCAGSGCNAGKIYFGKNYKQSGNGGNISVVGKTTTFKLGQNVAMVADLSQNAKAKTLTLKVTKGGTAHAVPYNVGSPKSNVMANLFTPGDLSTLGITAAGKYNFVILRGSKQLAKGSLTEK